MFKVKQSSLKFAPSDGFNAVCIQALPKLWTFNGSVQVRLRGSGAYKWSQIKHAIRVDCKSCAQLCSKRKLYILQIQADLDVLSFWQVWRWYQNNFISTLKIEPWISDRHVHQCTDLPLWLVLQQMAHREMHNISVLMSLFVRSPQLDHSMFVLWWFLVCHRARNSKQIIKMTRINKIGFGSFLRQQKN